VLKHVYLRLLKALFYKGFQVLVDERIINKGFADKMNSLPVFLSTCLPVKIVVGHQYLVFSKENTGKKEGNISPPP